MNRIEEKSHKELVTILSELIKTIELMMQNEKDYLLVQNKNEARDWLEFLKQHTDKDELRTLENEISNRFFYKFDWNYILFLEVILFFNYHFKKLKLLFFLKVKKYFIKNRR